MDRAVALQQERNWLHIQDKVNCSLLLNDGVNGSVNGGP